MRKNTVSVLGRIFCQVFLNNSAGAIRSHVLDWKVRPKFHMLLHLCESSHGSLNASVYSTWMDEDWLKKVARTMRLTNVRTSQLRTMQRWLLSIPMNLEEARSARS